VVDDASGFYHCADSFSLCPPWPWSSSLQPVSAIMHELIGVITCGVGATHTRAPVEAAGREREKEVRERG
jgi:hypothetical protein